MSLPFLQNYLGLSTGLQTRQASGGGVGGWKELGRTTLASNNTVMNVTSLSDKPYYMYLIHGLVGIRFIETRMRFNSDTGSNYGYRVNGNGGADATGTHNNIVIDGEQDARPRFEIGYVANKSNKEKLLMGWGNLAATGAATAPTRNEHVHKWANTGSAINAFNVLTSDPSGDNFGTGSEVVILGYDPADTHTTNFWQELSSTTLTTTASTINSGTITAKKYLWIQAFIKQASPYTVDMHCNGDTGSNYAARYSGNGGADASGTYTKLAGNYSTIAGGFFLNTFVINNYANEKLAISHTCEVPTTGAGTAPGRIEWASKWANTSSQITSIDITKEVGTGDLQSGSILKVWGSN